MTHFLMYLSFSQDLLLMIPLSLPGLKILLRYLLQSFPPSHLLLLLWMPLIPTSTRSWASSSSTATHQTSGASAGGTYIVRLPSPLYLPPKASLIKMLSGPFTALSQRPSGPGQMTTSLRPLLTPCGKLRHGATAAMPTKFLPFSNLMVY